MQVCYVMQEVDLALLLRKGRGLGTLSRNFCSLLAVQARPSCVAVFFHWITLYVDVNLGVLSDGTLLAVRRPCMPFVAVLFCRCSYHHGSDDNTDVMPSAQHMLHPSPQRSCLTLNPKIPSQAGGALLLDIAWEARCRLRREFLVGRP